VIGVRVLIRDAEAATGFYMERGSVGQTFLSARAVPCRQECLHHIGAVPHKDG